MIFEPRNRFVLLEELEQEEDGLPTILLPEDYKVKTKLHEVYRVLKIAKDCTKVEESDLGNRVVVENSMVEIIKVDREEYLVALENHIVGTLVE